MNILTKKLSSFSGLLFREQPSEPLTEESIESAVHERSSDRNGWSAGQEKKVFMIDLLRCKNYICAVRSSCSHAEFFLSDYESLKRGSVEKLDFFNTFFRPESRRVSQERTLNLDWVQNALVFTKEVSVLLSLVAPVKLKNIYFYRNVFLKCITDIT